MKTYYLYRHIRLDKNEPFYIGIGTIGTNRHNDKRRNDIWTKIYLKNNKHFEVDILLEDLTIEEANKKEIEFITLYGRIKNNTGILANIHPGGEIKDYKYKIPGESKKALAERMKGNKYSKGYKHSEEEKNKMKVVRKGRTPNKGKKFSKEWIENMRKTRFGNPSNTGKIWINNDDKSTLIYKDSEIPKGWKIGRIGWKNK